MENKKIEQVGFQEDACKSCEVSKNNCGSLNDIGFCKMCMEAYSSIDGQSEE